jgi:hypothetical protein
MPPSKKQKKGENESVPTQEQEPESSTLHKESDKGRDVEPDKGRDVCPHNR